ncbi:MAG: DUF4276 family protein [Candidatus Thiodiazotropha sp.]
MANVPIGFVVEGHGEFHCYPSLFCKAVNASGINVPRVNAQGCGSIVKRLPEHLSDLCIAHQPLKIIVTVDLQDVLDQGLSESCADLVSKLNILANDWLEQAANDSRITTLPTSIVAVVQILKFETWLISDTQGLKNSGLVNEAVDNVEQPEQVANPSTWIKDNLNISGSVKSPRVAKCVTSALAPDRMRQFCPSFDKFYRECVEGYQLWLDTEGT